jgi:hypothetical protein
MCGINPWYLKLEDKPRKVKCKFYNNVISYHKDIMFPIWAINMMAMGELESQCVQGTTIGESPICLMWWTSPSTIKIWKY